MLFLYLCVHFISVFFFFFKQKTAYEMRISDWSSDVCSSDLRIDGHGGGEDIALGLAGEYFAGLKCLFSVKTNIVEDNVPLNSRDGLSQEIGRASCRERVCQYV